MSPLEMWLIEKLGSGAASRIMSELSGRTFAGRLTRRVRKRHDVKVKWVEGILLRRLLKSAACWEPLLAYDAASAEQLAKMLVDKVLIGGGDEENPDRSPRNIARALQDEVIAALEGDGQTILVDQRLRDLLRRTDAIAKAVGAHDSAIGTDAFIPLDMYFAPTLAPRRRYHHRASLIGRDAELGRIVDAFSDPEGARIVVLSGRAGSGKSRIALAALDSLKESIAELSIVVRVENRDVSDAALIALPSTALVVLFEDAHRDPEGLAAVLTFARQRDDLRVLVTTRGEGNLIDVALRGAHFDGTETENVQLEPLSAVAARALVRELASDDVRLVPSVAEALAQAARFSPVVAVLAISMIRLGELTAPLTLDQNVRAEIMARFGTVVTQGIDGVPAARAQEILALVAALGSASIDDPADMELIAAFVGVSTRELLDDLGRLQEAGTLVERRHRVRVVPDVLADEILTKQAVKLGVDTGYVDSVWAAFAASHLDELVRNLAELDWRVAALSAEEGSTPPDLFGTVWNEIQAAVLASPNSGRNQWLRRLSGVAAYQPRRILGLVEELVAHQDPSVERSGYRTYSDEDVRRTAAPLVAICARADHTTIDRSIELLLQFSQSSSPAPNGDSDDPVRILQGLADLGRSGSREFAQELIDAVDRWTREATATSLSAGVIEALEPLTLKSGYTTDADRMAVHMQPYLIDPRKVAPIRDELRKLLRRLAMSRDVRTAVTAVDLLCSMLREPVGYFGADVTDEDVRAWEDDDVKSVAVLSEVVSGTTEPLVRLHARDPFDWHLRYGRVDTIKTTCRAALEALDDHLEDLLTDCLIGGFHSPVPRGARRDLSTVYADEDAAVDESAGAGTAEGTQAAQDEFESAFARREAHAQAELDYVARFLWDCGDPSAAVDVLADRVRVIKEATGKSDLHGIDRVLRAFCGAEPGRIADVVRAIEGSPSGDLDYSIATALDVLATHDEREFADSIRRILSSRTTLIHGALFGFRNFAWVRRYPELGDALLTLTTSADEAVATSARASCGDLVRANLLGWAERLPAAADAHPAQVVALIESAAQYDARGWVATLSLEEQRVLLSVLTMLNRWDYLVCQLAAEIARELPADVLRALGETPAHLFSHDFASSGLSRALSNDPQAILDWVAEGARESDERQFRLQRVWPLVVGASVSEGAATVIRHIASEGTVQELDFLAGGIAQDDGFAVREIELTAAIVDRASQIPGDAGERVRAGLRMSGFPSSYSRALGQPAEEYVRARDASRTASQREDLSDATRSFYVLLADRIQHRIDDDLRRDRDEEEE